MNLLRVVARVAGVIGGVFLVVSGAAVAAVIRYAADDRRGTAS